MELGREQLGVKPRAPGDTAKHHTHLSQPVCPPCSIHAGLLAPEGATHGSEAADLVWDFPAGITRLTSGQENP